MTRTKLCDRKLPSYSRGEEIFNMVSHITGGGFGVIALIMCVITSAVKGNVWGIVSGTIYGASLTLLYTMSSIYHGLHVGMAKKVMQVMDHCTIYFLICGTYTPILLCAMRPDYPVWAWVLFSVVWGFGALGATFTAIDLKRFSKLSMACYIGMGWCIVAAARVAFATIPTPSLLWLLFGGIAYTVGAILYGVGKKHKYVHSIFHLFVVLGSILQFIAVYFYIIL